MEIERLVQQTPKRSGCLGRTPMMTTWIARLVQHTRTRSQSLGWSPKTKLEQFSADGPRSGPFPSLPARRSELYRPSHLAPLRALSQLLLLWAALPSKPPGSAESVEPAASALGRRAPDTPGRSAFHATQLSSSPSDLPAPGPDEKVIETVFPPRTIPLLPNLVRTRRIAASDAASRDFFPATRAHDAIVSVPESHDDTLDFSIEPASLTAVAANDDSAWKFRTAARLNTAVGGGEAAAREMFPAPRPQDGTQDFSIESTFLAAVATEILVAPVLLRALLLQLERAMRSPVKILPRLAH